MMFESDNDNPHFDKEKIKMSIDELTRQMELIQENGAEIVAAHIQFAIDQLSEMLDT